MQPDPTSIVGQRDAKPFGHTVQRPAIDAHHFGCPRTIPADGVEHVQQVASLDFVKARQIRKELRGHVIAAPSARCERQIRLVNHRIPAEQHEPFYRVFELAYVARPRIVAHPRQCAG